MIAFAKPADRIPEEPKLSLAQVAKRLGLHRCTVYRLVSEGRLRTVRIGRRHHSYPSWIDEYLLSQQNTLAADSGRPPTLDAAPLDASPLDTTPLDTTPLATRHGVSFASS